MSLERLHARLDLLDGDIVFFLCFVILYLGGESDRLGGSPGAPPEINIIRPGGPGVN